VDCPFCAIVAGRVEASLVAETDSAVAFMDQRQAVPGHVLVVPRVHAVDIYQLAPEIAGEVMQLAVRVACALRATYEAAGLNLWQSNGEAGGQEVAHFHLHVQPRRHGDGLLRIYPGRLPASASRSRMDQMASEIRGHFHP
jgi:histidine triad (HIT) family protein